jgi:hypothetical protein
MKTGSNKGLIIGAGCGCVALLCASGAVVGGLVYMAESWPKPGHVPATPSATSSPSVEAPTLEPMEPAGPGTAPGEALPSPFRVTDVKFTDEGGEADRQGRYTLGERIHYKFEITGATRDDAGTWDISMHLTVTSPSGVAVLDQTMVDQAGDLAEPLPLSGYVELPEGSEAGTYRLHAVTRDKRAGVELTTEATFEMQPPG